MKQCIDRILNMKENLITVRAEGVALGEMAYIHTRDGRKVLASVISINHDLVVLQALENTRGMNTDAQVVFLKHEMQAIFSDELLGRRFTGACEPADGGPKISGKKIPIGTPSFNPVKRKIPKSLVRTNIPMIDVFNCLVKSQKIPIFSVPGEPYNKLLMRIGNQTDADYVIIGGMGLRFEDELEFIKNAESSGTQGNTVMFIHRATDPVVECLLVPDMCLAVAEQFAITGKSVLVLLTDMTAFADAMKEIMITMDQVPSNRGYPGSQYSDLASRYEKAVDIEGSGSITIVTVTTMPGDDVTHPIPDNTGYITEGQFYLNHGRINPFGSLSRLKQNVIGKSTRRDHGPIADTMIRFYADSKKASERHSMGFRLSQFDQKLIHYASLFEKRMMDLNVNIPLEEALDLGWKTLSECFKPEEVGINEKLIAEFWPTKE